MTWIVEQIADTGIGNGIIGKFKSREEAEEFASRKFSEWGANEEDIVTLESASTLGMIAKLPDNNGYVLLIVSSSILQQNAVE